MRLWSHFPPASYVVAPLSVTEFFRESFLSRRIRRIPAGSEVFIKPVKETQILRGDFKVKNIGIFEDACTIGRFGNDHQAALQSPADEDLRC